MIEKKAWDATLLEVEAKAEYYATCCQLLVTATKYLYTKYSHHIKDKNV